ncbi:hypothetical protein N7520_001741 [Penicillium odoratum]|nr:uncharacterized protein N7520_001741 [Penicillium odoratum]KAJ5778495.1 hypothetical protein N7520_001741 [Penicillium odoratum]
MLDCTRAGVRGASCAECRRHFCAIHLSKKYQTCQSRFELSDAEWEKSLNDEFWELLCHVNTHELIRLATKLNDGIKCKFELGNHIGADSLMGCANYNAWLCFENGERWIFRTPRTGFSDIPLNLVEYSVMSEYATLKFLESSKVPASKPFAYDIGSDSTNRVGVGYILMQALPGVPFYAPKASASQKKHIIKQLAEVLIEFSKHPLPLAGSLVIKDDEVIVGPVARNRFVALETYGPLDTALEYLISISEQHLDLIADGQLYPDYPVEGFLFFHLVRQNIQSLVSKDLPRQFFLKHVDDKGDHLLVDENFNITSIIDWQFARAVPASEAFGPSYITADLMSLYGSNTGVTGDDHDLATDLRDKGSYNLVTTLL